MAVWSAKYVNDLPDSSFAWIESGGKKDEEGKIVPRSLRHLPYKDKEGNVDLPHVRNALARLNQVKGMPESVQSGVRTKLEKLLEKQDAETINYNTTFTAEIKEENGKAVVFLSGTLMNAEQNSNFWQVPAEELEVIAAQYPGSPVKIQHAASDWDIVGSGISANVVENTISYIAKITDTKAVDKFVSGTWTAKNMGISPSVQPKSVTCTICGKDLTKDAFACPHIVGESYEGKIAGVITKGNRLAESSLTSMPAYKNVGAGSIEDVNTQTMIASIQKITKMEEKKMAEKTELEAKVAELEALSKELETFKAEIVTVKAELKKAEEEIKKKKKKDEDTEDDDKDDKVKEVEKENAELKEELEASKKEVTEFKNTVREAELKTLVTDETLVAEILKKELTDEQFKAELEIIGRIQTLSASTNGSAPTENGSGDNKDVFQSEFGASKDEIVKRLMGSLK